MSWKYIITGFELQTSQEHWQAVLTKGSLLQVQRQTLPWKLRFSRWLGWTPIEDLGCAAL